MSHLDSFCRITSTANLEVYRFVKKYFSSANETGNLRKGLYRLKTATSPPHTQRVMSLGDSAGL